MSAVRGGGVGGVAALAASSGGTAVMAVTSVIAVAVGVVLHDELRCRGAGVVGRSRTRSPSRSLSLRVRRRRGNSSGGVAPPCVGERRLAFGRSGAGGGVVATTGCGSEVDGKKPSLSWMTGEMSDAIVGSRASWSAIESVGAPSSPVAPPAGCSERLSREPANARRLSKLSFCLRCENTAVVAVVVVGGGGSGGGGGGNRSPVRYRRAPPGGRGGGSGGGQRGGDVAVSVVVTVTDGASSATSSPPPPPSGIRP